MYVGEEALPGNHSRMMTRLLQAGPGTMLPELPTYQNPHTPPLTPHEHSLLFLPLRIIQETWHTSHIAEM